MNSDQPSIKNRKRNITATGYQLKSAFCLFVFSILMIGQPLAAAAQIWEKNARQLLVNGNFTTENRVYSPKIASVQLYPEKGTVGDALFPPAIPLNSPQNLVLTFDEFGDDASYFRAKIYHCNADWQISGLKGVEYLSLYNEFDLNDFTFSQNTKVPYVHFRFPIPPVKVSGNYLLKVYAEDNEEAVVITQRFIVFENLVRIAAKEGVVVNPAKFLENQQIDFTVAHPEFALVDPLKNVTVHIRQNYRWDNAILDLKPRFIRQGQQLLDFSYFNLENAFKGGNEFRKLNFTSYNGGFNVQKVSFSNEVNYLSTYRDIVRGDKTFNQQQIQDFNGRYVIGNGQGGEAAISSDYAWVTFRLGMQNPIDNEVYVHGGFTDFKLLPYAKMDYDFGSSEYQATLLLKQGNYDYWYATYNPKANNRDEYLIEGAFRLAENDYDILVYFRPLGGRGDLLIGYWQMGR